MPELLVCPSLVLEDKIFGRAAIVVLRCCRFVVSALGGGGRDARIEDMGRTEARQRKHSPVP